MGAGAGLGSREGAAGQAETDQAEPRRGAATTGGREGCPGGCRGSGDLSGGGGVGRRADEAGYGDGGFPAAVASHRGLMDDDS